MREINYRDIVEGNWCKRVANEHAEKLPLIGIGCIIVSNHGVDSLGCRESRLTIDRIDPNTEAYKV